MARRQRPKKPKDQHSRFVEAAREVGADLAEEAFKRALGKIAAPRKTRIARAKRSKR